MNSGLIYKDEGELPINRLLSRIARKDPISAWAAVTDDAADGVVLTMKLGNVFGKEDEFFVRTIASTEVCDQLVAQGILKMDDTVPGSYAVSDPSLLDILGDTVSVTKTAEGIIHLQGEVGMDLTRDQFTCFCQEGKFHKNF